MMRTLNEDIARRANNEDKVTGRFWEGRFKSQALVDEQGLLTCMTYVDLNPVRAGLASTLEESDFTSIQERLEYAATQRRNREKAVPQTLAPFAGQTMNGPVRPPIPIDFASYVELLEWTGRAMAPMKRGRLNGPPPAILRSFQLSPVEWVAALAERRVAAASFLGSEATLVTLAQLRGKRWIRGVGLAKRWAA